MLSQKRKNKDYAPPEQEIAHVKATLELFSVLLADDRFEQIYNERMEGGAMKMDAWLDKVENRGREAGIIAGREAQSEETALLMLKGKEPLDEIVKYTLLSLDQVKKLGKLHSLL